MGVGLQEPTLNYCLRRVAQYEEDVWRKTQKAFPQAATPAERYTLQTTNYRFVVSHVKDRAFFAPLGRRCDAISVGCPPPAIRLLTRGDSSGVKAQYPLNDMNIIPQGKKYVKSRGGVIIRQKPALFPRLTRRSKKKKYSRF